MVLQRRVIPFSVPDHSPRGSGRVIQIGWDEELSRLRALILTSAGYWVRSIVPQQATAELYRAREAQVWVFCHTLEFYELALLATAVRRERPGDKLLRLTGLNDVRQAPGLFDDRLEPVDSIEDLLRMVAGLAKH